MAGVYVHVPYCAAICGYCDFNTYVGSTDGYVEAALRELATVPEPADTVFFGGGTPTLLAPEELGRLLAAIEVAPGAEITVEANPETLSPAVLEGLLEAGFNRISIGMQSAVPHVLAQLERVHTAGRAPAAALEARAAGFGQVSLDLIFGAPAETDADWRETVDAALAAAPDHISAYGLTVEPGTRLFAAVRAGRTPAPDPDAMARRYELADDRFTAAGLPWYEVANFGEPCRHNQGYWAGVNWWGIGPGAHSHAGGVRWWNVKRPADWMARLAADESVAAGREVLDPWQREAERIMLGIRTREGLPAEGLDVEPLLADGLLVREGERVVLTRRGRLLADHVTRELVPDRIAA